MRRILIGVDGSESAARAVELVADMMARAGAELTLVHVVPPSACPAELEAHAEADLTRGLEQFAQALTEQAAALARAHGATVRSRVATGPPAQTLAQLAQQGEYDLVAVGCRGQGAVRRALLGSVSSQLVQLCRRPVLVVR